MELRPVSSAPVGSVYSSPAVTLEPALCRVDLLESAPHAADRMHWHPVMDGGEPGDRVFDVDMVADPVGWLVQRLPHVDELLGRPVDDAAHIAGAVDQIADAVRAGLVRTRQPWPVVRRDERGMATA